MQSLAGITPSGNNTLYQRFSGTCCLLFHGRQLLQFDTMRQKTLHCEVISLPMEKVRYNSTGNSFRSFIPYPVPSFPFFLFVIYLLSSFLQHCFFILFSNEEYPRYELRCFNVSVTHITILKTA